MLIMLYDEYKLFIIITEIYIFLELIHLITESLYPLASISPVVYPEPLVAIIPLSAAMSLTVLDSTHKWYYNIVILNLAYFTKCNVLEVEPCCHKWQISLSSAWLIFLFLYIPHVLYPSIHWRTFRLLPFLGYCEWCCNGHGVQVSFQYHDFSTFGWIPRSGITRPHGSPIFNILRKFHIVCHNGCTDLHFHPWCARVPLSTYLY